MSGYNMTINDRACLPTGYVYGAHVSGSGWAGHYVIRERDGASVVARETPEDIDAPTAESIDAAIADAARVQRELAEERERYARDDDA